MPDSRFTAMLQQIKDDEVDEVDITPNESALPFMDDNYAGNQEVDVEVQDSDVVKVVIHTPAALWPVGAMEFQVSVGLDRMDEAVQYLMAYVNGPLSKSIKEQYPKVLEADQQKHQQRPSNYSKPGAQQGGSYSGNRAGGQQSQQRSNNVGPSPKQVEQLVKIFGSEADVPDDVWGMTSREVFDFIGAQYKKNRG